MYVQPFPAARGLVIKLLQRMKTLLLFTLLIVFAGSIRVQAQWKKTVGINIVLPPTARTLELTSEFSPHPAYALTFNAGYTHRASFQGFSKVHDGVWNRQSSGAFFKLGGRAYLLSLAKKQPPVNLFVGAQLIGSSYRQSARVEIIDPGFWPVTPNPHPKVNGFIWGAALTSGLTIYLTKRIALDGGIQYGFQPTRDDYIGRRSFNYQPGFGLSRSGEQVTSLQGILNVKYRL